MTADQASNLQDTQSDENEHPEAEAPVLVVDSGPAHLSATSQTEVGE